jgi:hypothetical protein
MEQSRRKIASCSPTEVLTIHLTKDNPEFSGGGIGYEEEEELRTLKSRVGTGRITLDKYEAIG